MALFETREGAARGKRPFNQAFTGPQPGLAVSPKKFSPTPLSLLQSDDQPTYEDYGDEGALLLVAFANHKTGSGNGSEEMGGVEPHPSPIISEDPARSDSSSETTVLSSSRMQDSSSEGDEYEESVDFESDDGLGGSSQAKIGEDGNAYSGPRRRAGQHFNKRRHRTSAEQLRVLEMTYAGNKVPNQELRKDLAQQLGMTTRRVQIWFQNKRAKEKRLRNSAAKLSTSSTSLVTPMSTGMPPQHLSTLSNSMILSSHPHAHPSMAARTLTHRASFSDLPSSSSSHLTPSSYSAPSRSFSPLAPPTLSSLLGSPGHESSLMSSAALGGVAWIPQSAAPLCYPPMIHFPQMTPMPPQTTSQPMLYPSMWASAPLR